MRALAALALAAPVGCSSPPARPFTPVDLPADPPGASRDAAGSPAPGGTDGPRRTDGAVSGPKEETIVISPGVRVVVEWPAVSDPDTTGMINAFRDYRAGSYSAVVTRGADTAYLNAMRDEGAWQGREWVGRFIEHRTSLRGVSRIYAMNVAAVDGRGATFKACVDETGMRLLDAGTGTAVRKQPSWTRKPFLQTAGMRRGDDGVWRIVLLQYEDLPSEPAKGCLR
ncbi:hypothetical protein ACFYSC_08435 [Streptosporangium sp. NPDC004379]|uniref:hypothetical protein n=1 Tax=Streptosporangium sp. NPDC004379 TaxID=3366189 RepID=UPI0036743107